MTDAFPEPRPDRWTHRAIDHGRSASPTEYRRLTRHEDLLRRADERLLMELWRFFNVVRGGRVRYLHDPVDALALGTVEIVINELRSRTVTGLKVDGDAATTHDPAAGRVGTERFAWWLRWRLSSLGVGPNPLPGNHPDAVDVDELIELAGGQSAWEQTRACDRPVLILRRVVRAALDPATPTELPDRWEGWEDPY